MSERIGVYYSHGQDFGQVLRGVRARFPEAWVCAVAPAYYEWDSRDRACIDSVVDVEQTSYRLSQYRRIATLVRQLRALKCDRFIFLFQTEQLRVLASLAGAKQCACWGVDSRITRLAASPMMYFVDAIRRRSRGFLLWVRLWVRSRVAPIRRVPASENDGGHGGGGGVTPISIRRTIRYTLVQ